MPTSNAALISRRAASLPGNPFAEADARAAAAVAAGKDIIDLSKGNPDGRPPSFVQDALSHASHNPSLFRYPPFDGLPEYLNAIAGWYSRQHNVTVDPVTQLLATSGSSVGITTVIQTLVDLGDTVVAVGPYYPQYEGSTAVAGGQFETIPADPSRGFLPDSDAVNPALWTRAKLLILNYPNNPTGAAATPELYETAVRLAKQYGFIVLNDFAYAGLEFGDVRSLSLLETPRAGRGAGTWLAVQNVYGGRLAWRIRDGQRRSLARSQSRTPADCGVGFQRYSAGRCGGAGIRSEHGEAAGRAISASF